MRMPHVESRVMAPEKTVNVHATCGIESYGTRKERTEPGTTGGGRPAGDMVARNRDAVDKRGWQWSVQ